VKQHHADAMMEVQQQLSTLLDADKRSKEMLAKMSVRMEAFMSQQKQETGGYLV
jgi:hypothetical protein